MLQSFLCAAIVVVMLFVGCAKQKAVTQPEITSSEEVPSVEPIQSLAAHAAGQIKTALANAALSTIEFSRLDGHDIFQAQAFSYFENSLAAQLGTAGIQLSPGEVKLNGDLSKQKGQILFTFEILEAEARIYSGSVQIPDDQRLENTLAQFEPRETVHDHSTHQEMPVPTPLVELKRIPLDIAEHCKNQSGDCTLLLLYREELVERNWKEGTERLIRFSLTGLRSRAPSGKIVKSGNLIFILTNELSVPLVYDENLGRSNGKIPSHWPKAEPGLNTFALADGRFFDFAPFGVKGLAVVDLQNRVSVADQGKLVSAREPAGGTLHVSSPYIYTSAPLLPAEQRDILQKFLYKDGLLQMQKSQNIDGSVYDITITDLNRDGKQEMLVTVHNSRGIFIEVYEPL